MITNRWFLPRIFRSVVNPATAQGGLNLWIILEMRSDARGMSGGFQSLEYNIARRYRVHGKPIYDCLFRAKTVNARWRNNRSSRLLFLLSLAIHPSSPLCLRLNIHALSTNRPGWQRYLGNASTSVLNLFLVFHSRNSPPPLIYINRVDLMQCVGVGWCFFSEDLIMYNRLTSTV